MSNDYEDDTVTVEATEVKYLATLVRGECHYLGAIRFDHGVPTVIMEHHKDHLEEHAVDVVGDNDGEVMVKDKFTFDAYNGPLEVGIPVGASNRNRDDRDRDSAERLRNFQDMEALRLQKAKREPAKFDPEARRNEVESLNAQGLNGEDNELTSAPRPRARSRTVAPRTGA